MLYSGIPDALRELSAGAVVICLLLALQTGVFASGDKNNIAGMRSLISIMPPEASKEDTGYPLQREMRAFLKGQAAVQEFKGSGLTGEDYLRVIDRQVQVFRKCQDAAGAIIDPVQKIEWQYSTPCYALSVALLVATGHNSDPSLLESGVKAMNCSVDEMHENRTAHNHGEFFIQPVMMAYDLYAKLLPAERVAVWKQKLSDLDPYKLYPDNLKRKEKCYNHNVVALAGEYLRIKGGFRGDNEFLETHLKHQTVYLSPLGMYEDPAVPMVYDEFSRQFIASLLAEGYSGPTRDTYREHMWRGAWSSLFMQSPFGECPTGGRSAQHIWNEAQCAVTYEIYAAQYAREKKLAEAGAFKRAAHLSLGSIQRWLRPDGSGYVVKNRYPIEAQFGYERYSAQSQYNLLACWLMAVAYLYSDESVVERPCPADLGGFAAPMVQDFHKVFANAGGTYVEYETKGDLHYNPTGLIRIHVKGSNPQLGPSDGVVHKFAGKPREDLGGENMCVGPGWQDAAGVWHRLADFSPEVAPKVEVLDETPSKVRFRVTYKGDFGGATQITETLTVEPTGVTVEDTVKGDGVKAVRVWYPMLVFDGLEETKVSLEGNSVSLHLRDGGVRYELLEPEKAELKRAGVRLEARNGMVEGIYADVPGTTARYRVTNGK